MLFEPHRIHIKPNSKVVGSWSDIDTGKLIADIYPGREEGSRPMSRA
jgi:hypothetical protein